MADARVVSVAVLILLCALAFGVVVGFFVFWITGNLKKMNSMQPLELMSHVPSMATPLEILTLEETFKCKDVRRGPRVAAAQTGGTLESLVSS